MGGLRLVGVVTRHGEPLTLPLTTVTRGRCPCLYQPLVKLRLAACSHLYTRSIFSLTCSARTGDRCTVTRGPLSHPSSVVSCGHDDLTPVCRCVCVSADIVLCTRCVSIERLSTHTLSTFPLIHLPFLKIHKKSFPLLFYSPFQQVCAWV